MRTVRRDLRSGKSPWLLRRLPAIRRSRLTSSVETDVLVVGAGISGALVAEMLASDGHRVVIVDRRGPAEGSTSASTALCQFEIDEPLSLLTRRIGAADAIRAWRRSYLAVQGLAARTSALGIDATLDMRDSLYLAGDRLDADGLAREAEARRAAGIETQMLERAELKRRFDIARPAALLSRGNFGADPRRLTAGYLRAAIAAGARLAAPVEIIDLDLRASGPVALTRAGRIACKTLVFATGYEVPDIVPAKGHQLVSTYAVATTPQPRRLWPGRCLIWEAADPYLYARTTADGRAIIGGEDEKFVDGERRDALLPDKAREICRKAAALFPGLDLDPDLAWTGTFGASSSGLPTIGPIPGQPRVWAVLGFGGNGITYSRIAAEMIRTALAGGTDPDADLYAFR